MSATLMENPLQKGDLTEEMVSIAAEWHRKDRARFEALLATFDHPGRGEHASAYRSAYNSFLSVDQALLKACDGDQERVVRAKNYAFRHPVIKKRVAA